MQVDVRNGARPLAGCVVLVVEDQYLVAEAIREAIELLGGRVLGPAARVSDALGLILREQPDVAMLDVDLNGEKIYPVAAELATRQVPFAFTTGFDGAELAPPYERVPHLSKPVRLAALARMLVDLSARAGQ